MRTLIFIFASLLAVSSQAREITVDNDGPADFNNIQAAIDDSNNGDIIIVAEGWYSGDGNRDLDFGGKAITVRSTDPNDPSVVQNTVIYCQGDQSEPHRGFNFHSGEGPNSVVAGLTITDGYADNGGGIYCDNSSPTISHCTIKGNIGGTGGGICCYGSVGESNPVISNCTITGNWAYGHTFGGSAWGEAGGGGIGCGYHVGAARPLIRNCTIVGNLAKRAGPKGSGYGGGIYVEDEDDVQIYNCIIRNNYGYSSGSSEYLLRQIWPPSPWVSQVSYCDVQDGYSGVGNIDADPCFVGPGHWSWDITWVEGDDYHLKSQAGRWEPVTQSWVIDGLTSPCIDAGNPGCPLAAEYEDPNNTRINIGAYGGTAQASKTPANWALLADLTNDHKVRF